MKVDDAKAAQPDPTQSPDTKKPGSKPFSKVLEDKAAAGVPTKKGLPFGTKPGPFDPNAMLLPASVMPAPQFTPDTIFQPVAATPAADASAIQGLVQEILVATKPDGQNSVEIQFNSKTLDSLHVQISKDQDQIAIRFSAANESVSNLLSRNISQLSDALREKGLQVAPIQVELRPAPISSSPSDTPQRDGRRGGQSDQRRDQQQQQQRQR